MPTSSRVEKIRKIAAQRQEGIVVLEDIYDPHNAAAVLRTCEAFGFQTVFFVFKKQKKFSPKSIGKTTSASANKWLNFKIFTSITACLRELKKAGFYTYATVLDPHARPLYQTKFQRKKIALLFGNEHTGLSETAIALADYKLYLPMRGFVQSLNLSVTAAICLYELTRQRQKDYQKYLLPKHISQELIKKWLKQ